MHTGPPQQEDYHMKHRHRGKGQPTLNRTTQIDVYELPSARIGEKRDSLLPL